MRKHRETKKTTGSLKLLPITALSRDSREVIFRRSKSRSVNSPEVALAHESLTEWLNGENSYEGIDPNYRNCPESSRRILDLLKLVSKVVAELERKAPTLYPFFYRKSPEPSPIEEHAAIVHFGAISAALVDYATVPYLAFQPSSKLWGLGHWPVGLSGKAHNGMMQQLQPTFRPYGEVMAAHAILELVRSGALHRIKQCDCGLWFFMKRRDGVACSDRCRKRIHDRKPEVIEKRRKNAKLNAHYNSGKIHIQRYEESSSQNASKPGRKRTSRRKTK